jgi:hypothetical protein
VGISAAAIAAVVASGGAIIKKSGWGFRHFRLSIVTTSACHGYQKAMRDPDDSTHLYTVTGNRNSVILLPEQNKINV